MNFEDYVVQNHHCPHSRHLSRQYQAAFYRLHERGKVLDIELTCLEESCVPDWVAGDIVQCFARQQIRLESVHRYLQLYGQSRFYITGFRRKFLL